MTAEQAEIEKMVYDKYPKTKKEMTCWQERMRLTALRDQYKLRLIQGKREIEPQKISGIAH